MYKYYMAHYEQAEVPTMGPEITRKEAIGLGANVQTMQCRAKKAPDRVTYSAVGLGGIYVKYKNTDKKVGVTLEVIMYASPNEDGEFSAGCICQQLRNLRLRDTLFSVEDVVILEGE